MPSHFAFQSRNECRENTLRISLILLLHAAQQRQIKNQMRSFSIKFELLLPYDTFIQTPGAAVIFMWLYICWGKSSGGCTDQMCHNHTSEQREHAEQEGIFVLWGHFSLLLFLCE